MMQSASSGQLVCGAGYLERPRLRTLADCVGRGMSIRWVAVMPLVTLIKDDIMPLVDPGAFDAQAAERAHSHLSMFVAGEVSARTGDAPIDVALVVEDSAAAGAPSHKVDVANGRRFGVAEAPALARRDLEDAQIDLQPRVLVAPDDDARPVRVEEEHNRVGRRVSQNVVLDAEIHEGVGAARNVALELG